jgi:hypothetical protein
MLNNSRESSVGIATCYGLHGLGIESWWGPAHTRAGAQPAFYTMGIGFFFCGGKAAGEWFQPPPPSSAEVKERVVL